MSLRIILIFLITLLFFACAKEKEVYSPSKKQDPYKIYQEGLESFRKNDFFYASKKFSEAELIFSEPDNSKAALMSSFSLYGINFYDDAEENLKRYIKTYPSDENVIYAHYLLAIIYFEQISDEKDLQLLLEQKIKLIFF